MNPSWLIQPAQILILDSKLMAGDVFVVDSVIDFQPWPVMTLVNGPRADDHGQPNPQVLCFES